MRTHNPISSHILRKLSARTAKSASLAVRIVASLVIAVAFPTRRRAEGLVAQLGAGHIANSRGLLEHPVRSGPENALVVRLRRPMARSSLRPSQTVPFTSA